MPAPPKPAAKPACTMPAPRRLHHLGYRYPPRPSQPLNAVHFVLLCGSPARARQLALAVSPRPPRDLCRTDRYVLYAPHPAVLIASHGIGRGSIDPLLHELHHLLTACGSPEYTLIRLGTCGGIGLPPGTMVVTNRPLDGCLRPYQTCMVLGREQRQPATVSTSLSAALHATASRFGHAIRADTLCAESFHLAQGRCDGAFVEYSPADRTRFLLNCRDRGVRNIEMESLPLAAFASRMGVPCAVLCVVLVDRLEEDSPTESPETIDAFIKMGVQAVVSFVKDRIRR